MIRAEPQPGQFGGYTHGTKTFDALIFVYYEGKDLIYVARTPNGFTPATRVALFNKFKGLDIAECPFVTLAEEKSGRWGQGRGRRRWPSVSG